ncbi:MAG: hypothetical protein Q9227_004966 [Pyrenula ochraceoflavens]
MAPGILSEQPPEQITPSSKQNLSTTSFPSGYKSSGQHPPIASQLAPYSAFPKHIDSATAWSPSTYQSNPKSWIHPLTPAENHDLSTSADAFLASGKPLPAITKDVFPLGVLGPVISKLRRDLLNDKGFILFKNFPTPATAGWSVEKTATAYLGLSSHLGAPVSQNGLGHILGHVKDLGDDPTAIDRVRIYRTNARQFFHADDSDIVGLLCLARAQEGGESDLCSSNEVWNVLQAERPDIAELFTKPIWYFDRKGEVSQGEEEWIKSCVFYLEKEGQNGVERRVYCKYDPYFLRSLTRFSDQGVIPPLSGEQKEAMEVLESICHRLALHMILEVGDVQFLSNAQVLHARTAYKDWNPNTEEGKGKERRWLMRVWLATSEDEGGWRLPFHDSHDFKRGGIQVDDRPERCPLDAE